MANRRVSMRKIREVLRLYEECGLSNRQIARALNISRPVVGQYLTNFRTSGLTYREVSKMSDSEVMRVFEIKQKRESERYRVLSEKFEYFAKELKRKGVTLHLLWQEYKRDYPEGYGYSRFCYHFQVWRSLSPLTMHIEHKAGEKMFVDYTGKKLQIYDRMIGEEKDVEVFVAILAASQLTYAEATRTQKKGDWIKANENALWYFGGVPQIIVPDCLKSGVGKANRYEPEINPVYADFAKHYGTAIVPARPYSPKDKAMVENATKIVYGRVFAPLRNSLFFSLEELNGAIRERLEEHNKAPFQRMGISRKDLFNEIEKDALRELPPGRYELKEFRCFKVPSNYHIELREDNHYYSVPWQYRGKRITLLYTQSTVGVYHQNMRIALHKRERRRGYTTQKEHMPPNHRFYAQLSPEEMIGRAEKIGDKVKVLMEKVLRDKGNKHQALRTCLGITDLSRRYGPERLNRACKRALEFHCYSYKAVKNILEKGLDRLKEEPAIPESYPIHSNIRGRIYFN
ncbi:MAG: IS21 family transposase [Candidatus Hydrothermarchaeales archaeon]